MEREIPKDVKIKRNKLFRITTLLIAVSFIVSSVISMVFFSLAVSRSNKNAFVLYTKNIYSEVYGEIQEAKAAGYNISSGDDLTKIADFSNTVAKLQNEFELDISIVSPEGAIFLTTDTKSDKKLIDASVLDNKDNEIHVKKIEKGYICSRYIDAVKSYLVVEKEGNTFSIIAGLLAKTIIVLVIAFIFFFYYSYRIISKGNRIMVQNVQMDSYGVLAQAFNGMYLIDTISDTAREVKSFMHKEIKLFEYHKSFKAQLDNTIENWVVADYRDMVRAFMDMNTLPERLKENPTVGIEFIANKMGWCRARLIPVNTINRPGQYIFAVEHIDAEKRMQEELQKETQSAKLASEAKGRFLANMSHEIRTPINAVLGMDTMILRESKESHIKEYALIIESSGQTLLSLVNDILDFSKIESGKMEIIPVEYDFASLVNDVSNMVRMKAESKNLEVKMDISEDLPCGLIGDDVRIRQILVNLMNNAIKYTEKGSVTLSVHGKRVDDDIILKVAVKDTGIGIKEEDMHKLFAEFERIEEAKNRNVEGTGLGMSITIQLLSLMNSKLNVESEYGVGSTFHFELKQKISNNDAIGDFAKRISSNVSLIKYSASFTAPDANLLVVDDNITNIKVFKGLLKQTKVSVDEAIDGATAIDMIHKKKYDIIFVDHMMPDMDGIEVLEKVRSSSEHPNIDTTFIALTANAITGAKELYLEAGFTDYISKPIIPDKLEALVGYYLSEEKKIIGND